MLFLFGFLGCLHSTFLPGAIILKLLDFRGHILQRLAYIFGLSLMANYLLGFVLTVVHLFIQPVWLGLIVLEIIGLIWLYRSELQKPLIESLGDTWNTFWQAARELIPTFRSNPAADFAILLSMLTALYFILPLGKVFTDNIGTVFNAWDTVISWNAWAKDWGSNIIPDKTHFYPQLVPLSWASTYTAMGSTEIQFFAKSIMPLFAIFTCLLVFELGLRFKKTGFFIAAVLVQLLVKKFTGPEISNGYSDVAMTFFAWLPAHALIHAREETNEQRQKILFILSALFAAGAAITKQGGVYIFFFYLLLVAASQKELFKPGFNFKKFLQIYALAALLPVTWYLFKALTFGNGQDNAEVDAIMQVTSKAYNNMGPIEHFFAALQFFEEYLLLFPVILLGFFFMNRFYRTIVLGMVLPYPLVWAFLVGYDTRNLAIFTPYFALCAGISIAAIANSLYLAGKRLKTFSIPVFIIPILLAGLILSGSYAWNNERLLETHKALEMQNFSPVINEKIYAIVKKEGPDTKIMTNYPIRLLPGLANNHIQFSFRDYDVFDRLIQDPSIDYLLLPGNELDPKIVDYIDQKVAQKKYAIVLVDKTWMKFTLIRIIKR